MTSVLSGHFSIFGLVFFVLKSLLRTSRQWSHVKFAILTLKPRSIVRIIFNIYGMRVSLPFHFCAYIINKVISSSFKLKELSLQVNRSHLSYAYKSQFVTKLIDRSTSI